MRAMLMAAAMAALGAAQAEAPRPPPVAGKAYVLSDLTSGQVLAEHEADAQVAPASLAKLMTAYLVFAAMRDKGRPTVPARLELERRTNPFLRAGDADFKSRLGLENLPDAQAFAELRRRKDAF